MGGLLILLIKFYRFFISPLFPRSCRFEPTCSQYALDAIKHRGLISAILLITKRVSRCHPFHGGGYDPVKR
ncbi:MAG: membrane protein insertion efficiency factor YidD [Candidatus Marinimicrobia bacterium]|nr:membrane protein insertion efficiency factor YidD [Candidatus Neomarinimicrobiota bacterium]